MILMVSGRCDIVAFYTPWFISRYKEGYVDVRNPFYPKLVSRINFKDVDLIMFCTKNPLPIIPYLKEIDKPILFHVTLTPYMSDIEPNVIDKKKIIEGIKKVSEIVGIDNLYVRYDPILLNDKYTVEYHIKMFDRLCKKLNGYVKHIIISFVDDYKNVRKNMNSLKLKEFTQIDYELIGKSFYKSAKENNMEVQTCFEENNLVEYGFKNSCCLGSDLAFKLTGKIYKKWQARKCNCVTITDIGVYNSCKHFCKYCYANFDEKKVLSNMKMHDPNSSLLIGKLEKDDVIKEKLDR